MDSWKVLVESDNAGDNLSRFLIGFDELRVRLAPSKYPNLEITDEGYLWFNIDRPAKNVEIVGIPFEFKMLKAPALIVSFPSKAENVDIEFLEKLCNTAHEIEDAGLFAGASERDETLKAYEGNKEPPLTVARDSHGILAMREKGVFFSYLGVHVDIKGKTVSEIENTIKSILFKIEKHL